MKTKLLALTLLLSLCLLIVSSIAADPNAPAAQDSKTIQLPEPQKTGGKPLMQALAERKTSREFSTKELPDQVLSNLLWAAFGINRPDGKRTAPSAMNQQEIDIYVALAKGFYLYDAQSNSLKLVLEKDLRKMTGKQPFVEVAPVNLVYVADLSKMTRGSEQDKAFYSGADVGFIAQNVYLFCASENLATVVRGYVDKEILAKAIGLRPDQKVILAQTVGYPK
ncbi:MAG: SagB/ThcOx family dehydrogenase [Phycisphaerae bacterium]|jgi:SagB-type dehydrogenase family enzyme